MFKKYALFSIFFPTVLLSAAVTVTDFSNWMPDSTYGNWASEKGSALTSGPDAFRVVASNFGGVYKYLGVTGAPINLEDLDALRLNVTVHSQSNREAGIGFLVLLEDADGTVHRYSRFGVQSGAQTIHWALDHPSKEEAAGMSAGLDLSRIQAMNLQIDPGGANDYDVSFLSLAANSGEETESAKLPARRAAPDYIIMEGRNYHDRLSDPKYADCLLNIYYPAHLTKFPTVVFMHAGGLKQGQPYIPGELMGRGFAVVSAGYRLYPGARAPDFIEDAAAAVAWVFKNIEDLGGSKDQIFVSGSSAGGYLAKMVGLDKQWLGKHGIDANALAGIVSLSGQAITHVAIREERGIDRGSPVVDALAPLRHVRGDAAPLLLVTGDRQLELLGRYEENAYLKRMMELNGHRHTELHEIKGVDHAGVEKPGHDYLVEFVERVAGL